VPTLLSLAYKQLIGKHLRHAKARFTEDDSNEYCFGDQRALSIRLQLW
jgi:hypothetical protein